MLGEKLRSAKVKDVRKSLLRNSKTKKGVLSGQTNSNIKQGEYIDYAGCTFDDDTAFGADYGQW